jgi:uncharacterized membrane protein YkoI
MHRKPSHSLTALTLAVGLALSSAASAQSKDIGFARAEQVALTQVKGTVREIERDHKQGRDVFKVDVRTPDGKAFKVLLDASDGRVLTVKQDD